MKKIIISLIILSMILPMVIALPSGTCYKYEPILLKSGWNQVSIITNYSNVSIKDVTLNLVNSSLGVYNSLGYSAIGKTKLSDLKFYNKAGTMKLYNDAVSSGWIDKILFQNSSDLSSSGKPDKYNHLATYDGYWVRSYLAVNMTISNVNGESLGNTYQWSDLRFSNGSEEKDITSAETAGWINANLQYWGCDPEDDCSDSSKWVFYLIPSNSPLKNNISSWEGVFVYSFKENIYLLTNNETKRCSIKPVCISKGKPCKIIPNPKGKSIIQIISSLTHEIKLYGEIRK